MTDTPDETTADTAAEVVEDYPDVDAPDATTSDTEED
jgi:hypothetical protein